MAVGGADRMVCIWEVESGKIMYKVCFKSFLRSPGRALKDLPYSYRVIKAPSQR